MFIDYAIIILGYLVIPAYALANVLVVANYPIRFMWEEFWIEQKWYGKICANVFYLPAWIISFLIVAIVSILNFIIVPLSKIFNKLAKLINPIFKRAIKLEL